MNDSARVRTSKFLSLVLRHRPETIGISLDPAGWVAVGTLLEACARHGRSITRADLDEIVRTSEKKRFAFSEDGSRIRANQGHSVAVDLGYEPATPPNTLFHGTVEPALPSIRQQGLVKMDRHHVHMSPDEATARNVGSRRGRPVILRIDAKAMHEKGYTFFVTPNNVWLTDTVPTRFIHGL